MMFLKNDFKFGITDPGDACVNQTWTKHMHAVIGALISSKLTDEKFADKLLEFKDKVIYHACITGFGGTLFEPNIPEYKEVFKQIDYILDRGFKVSQIVLKIDSIIPACWFDEIESFLKFDYVNRINDILKNAEERGIKRVRYNFLSFHPQILNRLKNFNSAFVFPEGWYYDHLNELALFVLNKNFKYETSSSIFYRYADYSPVLSNYDLEVLNLDNKYIFKHDIDVHKNSLQLIPLVKTECPCDCLLCDLNIFNPIA